MKTGKTPVGVKTRLAMAFHGFQPVFNFEGELEKAFAASYEPFLGVLKDFPGIKGSFHFSGNMLEWFEKRHPEYLNLLRFMVDSGQIEIIGGGFFEPVMALIPERDAHGQIEMMNRVVERIFGEPPKGAWTTERVWGSDLADTLSARGIKYTILDDHHLLSAGMDQSSVFGPCRTCGDNSQMVLFPALTRFRYTMPFRRPEETINYIKNTVSSGGRDEFSFFFADDLEKFGAWPRTYGHVYKKGWLRKFFTLLEENSDWLEISTYSEVMDSARVEDIGRLSGESYPEMEEWSGGRFKNFLTKYPESGRMHKRMLSVSDMVEAAGSLVGAGKDRSSLRSAREELFKAQTGCPYWHGTFGGVYLPHLRSGVYKHLIKAENMIDGAMGAVPYGVRAVQKDPACGKGEVVISNRHLRVYVRPSRGGAVEEIDHRKENVNLVNSFSRRREEYHKKLEKGHASIIRRARKAALNGDFADIHEVLGVRERGLGKMLSYDGYNRGCFLTHVMASGDPWKCLANSRGIRSDAGFLSGRYSSETMSGSDLITQISSRRDKIFLRKGESMDIEVVKKITVGTTPSITFSQEIFRHDGAGDLELPGWAAEFNFLIWDASVIRSPRMFEADRFALKDRYSGICVDVLMDRRFTVVQYPVYTVNETEYGLGKTFQGISVLIGDHAIFRKTREKEQMRITAAIG
jgi:4-alpha-glucanotransferase